MKIEDRTIAIIGGSRNLEGKEMGSYIDSFDYVVKFNGAINLRGNKDYCKDYGFKDDIHFFTNPYIKEMKPDLDNAKDKPFFLFKKKYPRYKNIKFDVISRSFKEVESEMQKGFAYSGVAVLQYFLKFNPEVVHLMGMDLYINQPNYYDGNWSEYPEGYVPEKMKKMTDRLHSDGHLVHSRYWNAIVLKRIFLNNKNIIFNRQLLNNIDYIIKNRGQYE